MFRVHELASAANGSLTQGDAFLNVRGISINTRTIKKGDAFIAIKGDNFDGHDFIVEAINKGAACIVIRKIQNPKLKTQIQNLKRNAALIEVDDTVRALGGIAKFHRLRFDIPVIAVTGSNGKTTTKDMCAWVLGGACKALKNEGTQNNHIGVPMALCNLTGSHALAVVELGTNHFGEIGRLAGICCPTIGVITNIGPAHLEFFGTREGIMKEKYTLIEHLRSPYIAILNNDDALLKKKIGLRSKAPFTIGFGMNAASDFRASNIRAAGGRVTFRVNKKYDFTLNTAGCHNIYNALAVIAIARLFGMGYPECAQRLRSFDFPQGRGEVIATGGVRFIDDTYNSNPLSLRRALETLASLRSRGRKICVLGDMLELGKDRELFHRQAGILAAKTCHTLITVGELSKITSEGAYSSGLNRRNIFTCRSSREAAEILLHTVSPRARDIVLVKGSRRMKMDEVINIAKMTYQS